MVQEGALRLLRGRGDWIGPGALLGGASEGL